MGTHMVRQTIMLGPSVTHIEVPVLRPCMHSWTCKNLHDSCANQHAAAYRLGKIGFAGTIVPAQALSARCTGASSMMADLPDITPAKCMPQAAMQPRNQGP